MLIAPRFWERSPGLASWLLLPFGEAWNAAGQMRRALARPYSPPVPVVCVGNLVIGGAGKTPVTLSLARWFADRGIEVHVLTRGYGGAVAGPLRVNPAADYRAVGDEVLLHAARAPCWIARDRAAGARAAVAAGAQAILLDDGFQNPSIAKSLSLIVIDAAYGLGNGRVMPAGPLRESVAGGLARADAIVLVGEGAMPAGIGSPLPILHASLEPLAGERLAGRRLAAFAGIGRPEKFFTTLRSLGATLVAARPFPDHHPYTAAEIAALARAAEEASATLVTTAKDIVRVPHALRNGIEVLQVEIRWHNPDRLAELVAPIAQSVLQDDGGAQQPG